MTPERTDAPIFQTDGAVPEALGERRGVCSSNDLSQEEEEG